MFAEPTYESDHSMSSADSAGQELEGLQLAEDKFGPLLSPIPASVVAWNNYTTNRHKTFYDVESTFDDIFPEEPDEDEDEGPSETTPDTIVTDTVRQCVAEIEGDMGLEEETLQQCVCVLKCDANFDDMDDNPEPRTVDLLVRLYSPSAPAFIDVHLYYHCRPRYNEIEWRYSLGYKVDNNPSSRPANPLAMSMELSGMDMKDAHRYNHWQSISWGMYDDLDGDNSGPKWKRIEDGQFELSEGDVLGIYQTLFGKPIEDAKDEEGVIKRRRKLVNTVRLLFAVVGIGYHIACVDEEKDCESGYRYGGPGGMGYMLEGLSDTWIARGVRRACGFQLTKDPEQALSGTQERAEMEADDPYDNDEEFGEYITYYR